MFIFCKRAVAAVALAGLLGVTSFAAASDDSGRDTRQSLRPQLAQARSCNDNCAKQKDSCMAAGVREGSFGTRYVPPDVVGECNAAFRDCQKRCK